ncbi:CaiB/BaiF CoA transferase family protein [uncultured Sphingomonas sp.]|uniref:CaiB/BaiF CoA transferase family protein n=1 Tax=uncultured Sphingomonas sp. TaxID=158754 RepID=UPI0035CB2AF9
MIDRLPLSGMRVLDLSRALSGPFCSMILGDLGADVIKVEALPGGDMIRTWGPFQEDESAYYLSANRNKRGMALDFRSPEGRDLLSKMASQSDVLVENFKPGTMAAMGLDPDALRAANPALIVASISGFGSGGPLGDQPGFDQIAQGYSGFMSFTGTPETGPTRVGVAIGDMTSGMWLAIGILGAWIERQASGRGQVVETSLLASLVGLLSVQGQRYLSLGQVAEPTGNVHPVIAPYGAFRAQDGDLNIGAATQDMWLRLCDVIGQPELRTDDRFLNNALRMKNRDVLRDLIDGALATNTKSYWSEQLVAVGIPAGPINSVAEALDNDQVRHLGLVETVDHPTLGKLRQVAIPLAKPHSTNAWVRRAPPVLGQHTHEILRELNIAEADIDQLMAAKVTFQAPDPVGCLPEAAT